MTKRKPIGWRCFEKILFAQGFSFVRQKGSHRSYKHPNWGGRFFVLVRHDPLAPGTLSANIRKLGLSRAEFEILVANLC